MFGRFIYGQCSLSEAFWKFSVLGLFVISGLCRVLMILLKQTVNYDPNFFRVLINNLSLISMNPTALAFLAFYIASFLALLVYCFICVIGMWNTYKEYNKSKTLAIISTLLVIVLAGFAVKYSIY